MGVRLCIYLYSKCSILFWLLYFSAGTKSTEHTDKGLNLRYLKKDYLSNSVKLKEVSSFHSFVRGVTLFIISLGTLYIFLLKKSVILLGFLKIYVTAINLKLRIDTATIFLGI